MQDVWQDRAWSQRLFVFKETNKRRQQAESGPKKLNVDKTITPIHTAPVESAPV